MSNSDARLTALENAVGSLVATLQAQFSTPTATATAVVPAQAAPATPPVSLVKVTAEEKVLADAGLKRASGGHTVLSPETLVACARVLKTGTPEVVPVTRTNLVKRGVVATLVYRDADGSVFTQYCYSPAK